MNKKIINLPELIGGGYKSFWNTRKFFRICKGGRGSKKSTTTAMWFIYNIMKYPKSNLVCIRQTANTNRDSTFAELKKAATRFGVHDKWKFITSPLSCTYLPTGQQILFRGFDEVLKLTSMNVEVGYLCWAWFEEAYEIENEADFDTFVEAIRGKMEDDAKDLWKQITVTYNPWINSHWTKDRFWDCDCPHNVFRLTTTHKCNEWLDEEDHQRIEDLAITNPDRYKVVGLGEYGIPGGAYFDEFRTDIHVISEPFIIPQDWRRYRVIDYGLDMLAVLWIAMDTHGKAYAYREIHESNLIVSEAAKAILDATPVNEKIYDTIAPPDLWNRNRDTGKSTAEIMGDIGLWLTKADNNRIQGWYNMKEWLKPYADEQETMTANLVFFKNCVNAIRNIPQIQADLKDPNDCATQPHPVTHICLTGDTIINTPNGDYQIKDLVNTVGDIYCYDELKKSKTISNYFDCRLTQSNAPIYKVTLDDGRIVKCTKDHPFLTNNGWKRAIDLSENDDIIEIVL